MTTEIVAILLFVAAIIRMLVQDLARRAAGAKRLALLIAQSLTITPADADLRPEKARTLVCVDHGYGLECWLTSVAMDRVTEETENGVLQGNNNLGNLFCGDALDRVSEGLMVHPYPTKRWIRDYCAANSTSYLRIHSMWCSGNANRQYGNASNVDPLS